MLLRVRGDGAAWVRGYPLNRGLWQGGFPARLAVLLELEGMRLLLELEQNW